MLAQVEPVRAFKYVKPVDAHYLENESIFLGTFARYGELETLRDPDEGTIRATGQVSVINGADPTSRLATRRAERHHVHIAKSDSVRNISLNITSVDQAPPCAVFCLARRPTNAHLEALGLTCVWEIPDVRALAEFVWQSYPHILGRPSARMVRYSSRQVDLDAQVSPSPFVKDRSYSPEEEYRIAWPTSAAFTGMPVSLMLSRIRLLHRIR